MTAKNVLGGLLLACSYDPVTGYFRDGCCNTDSTDRGNHTICVRVTEAFLVFSAQQGNDLTVPMPELRFAGLKVGDRWCVCAARWQEALVAGCAPRVVLRATEAGALEHCRLEDLQRHGG